MRNSAIRVVISKLKPLTTSKTPGYHSQEWQPLTQWNFPALPDSFHLSKELKCAAEDYVKDVLSYSASSTVGSDRAEGYLIVMEVISRGQRFCLACEEVALEEQSLRTLGRAIDRLQSLYVLMSRNRAMSECIGSMLGGFHEVYSS